MHGVLIRHRVDLLDLKICRLNFLHQVRSLGYLAVQNISNVPEEELALPLERYKKIEKKARYMEEH